MSPVQLRIDGGIAHVTIDNPPVNALSRAVRADLMDALEAIGGRDDVSGVVLACAGRTFVAGADIREFDQPASPPHLPDLLMAIEACPAPWVAALHGTVLGGGLELALACHGRVAAKASRMGLPEVTLGLIPGAGGTVRLPRLVGAIKALEMIAGGKPIMAESALAMGLVDRIVDADPAAAAVDLLSTLEVTPTLSRALPPVDGDVFKAAAEKLQGKARGQVSIGAAIEAVQRAIDLPPEAALEQERQAFLALKSSDQAKALRSLFFAERATLADARFDAAPPPIGTVSVIGGGTMGAGIAAACLLAGLTVIQVERDQNAASAGAARVTAILDDSRKRNLIDAERHAAALARFASTTDYADLAVADVVIEAVFEDLDVKRDVFAKLDGATRPDCILATNTSYLDVNAVAAAVADPSRVIGLHFFSPAHVMKLLEIVVPDAASPTALAAAKALAKRLRKIAVPAGVCDGFIGNRIMSAYRREADYLIEDGALPADVDLAMRDFGFPIGVFEMQDLAGLDIAWAMRKRRAASRPPEERYVAIADRLCEAGRFGRKTGSGWYSYADGRQSADPWLRSVIDAERAPKGITPRDIDAAEIMARILGAMQREARAVLDDGIAARPEDIDVVMTSGYGFPRWRGGPMHMAAVSEGQ